MAKWQKICFAFNYVYRVTAFGLTSSGLQMVSYRVTSLIYDSVLRVSKARYNTRIQQRWLSPLIKVFSVGFTQSNDFKQLLWLCASAVHTPTHTSCRTSCPIWPMAPLFHPPLPSDWIEAPRGQQHPKGAKWWINRGGGKEDGWGREEVREIQK